MNFRLQLKRWVEETPEWIARPLTTVPYSLRLGHGYTRAVKSIRSSEVDDQEKDANRLANMRDLVQSAVARVPFYRDFYARHGFAPDDLKSWSDWERVPVVTKADLQNAPLLDRVAREAKGLKINTGGTSGQPLEFYLDNQAFAREWAHMHYLC